MIAAKSAEQCDINARLVGTAQRSRFLVDLFGNRLAIVGESRVFGCARRLSTDYTGGYWNFYRLTNGSGYLAPEVPPASGKFDVCIAANSYEGSVSADAFGIIVTSYVLNGLVFDLAQRRLDCDVLADKYHALVNYAKQHDERIEILRAID
ncbi:Antirestriction protein KlcA [Burkholderia diffusa]|uniref:antirestriction protein n=1 Tax=Burkholderia diffusa TaxID=488732 RepID=UPI001CB4C6DB|nr:antirestriction protein [Burkholderia diffusa]CAG9264754.1 Antirestriction protein KlcA [Burkholderia diffusa]